MGFDADGTPQLFQTEPSGNYTAWKVRPPPAPLRTATIARRARLAQTPQRRSELGALSEDATPATQAVAIGRNQKTVKEFLEKHYSEATAADGVKLACRALLEVVEAGGKNIEVAVLRPGKELQLLTDNEVDAIVAGIEAEKEAEEKAKKKPEV